jgi:hypothetical protein
MTILFYELFYAPVAVAISQYVGDCNARQALFDNVERSLDDLIRHLNDFPTNG